MPAAPSDVGVQRAAEPSTTPARRHVRRCVVWAAGIGVAAALVVGVANIPTGRVAERPWSVLDLAARVSVVGDTPVTPIDGRLDGLTVSMQPLDLAGS